VLEDIAKWLGESYEQDIKLHAVMYLHRITDNRLGGVALRNLVMFKKLCGPDFFPRVCLITTRWDEVSTSDGIRREEEMIKTDEFWGRMVEGGAYVLRHDGSEKSAMHILDQVLQNHAHDKPSILKVQHELVNEHLRLSETAAGRTFEAELIKQREEHQRQIKQLQKDMQELLEMNERKAADETEKVKNDLERRIQQSFEDQRRLQADFEALHRESVEKVRRMQEQLERQQQEYEAKVEHLEQMKHQITLYKPNDPKAQYLADEINREQQELPKLATTIEIQKGSLQQTVKRKFETILPISSYTSANRFHLLLLLSQLLTKFFSSNRSCYQRQKVRGGQPKTREELSKMWDRVRLNRKQASGVTPYMFHETDQWCFLSCYRFASAVMRQRQMNKSLSQHNHSFGGPPNPSPMHSFGQRSQGPVVEELDDGEEEANVNAHPSGFGHVKTEAELNADYQKSFYLT
jgi:hypothetical protein